MKMKRILGLMGFLFLFTSMQAAYAQETITLKLFAKPDTYSGKCPATIHFKGRIAVSKPGKVQYRFLRSDGASMPVQTLNFEKSGWKDVSTTWTIGKSYYGWMVIKVLYPRNIESNKAYFKVECKKRKHPPVKAIPKEGQPSLMYEHEAYPVEKLIKLEQDTDRPGFDYKNFELPEGRPELCRDACMKDPRCKAFTYVKPGFQGPKARCWLKSEAPDSIANRCCISGVIPETLPRPPSEDKDEDGIPDKVETELLNKYSPFYLFSKKRGKKEHYRPADAIWQIRNAQMKKGSWTPGNKPPTVKSCGNPEESYHLDPPDQVLTCVQAIGTTDLWINPTKTNYYLNISDDRRGGHAWPVVIREGNIGTYGHVVPAKNGFCRDANPKQVLGQYINKLYKIEYWQYFAYSGQDVHGGDHEGDWNTVQLWYDPTLDKLVFTCHFAHGKGICFDMRTYTDMAVWDNILEYRGLNYGKDCKLKLTGGSRYPANCQNNHVRFYDKTHIVVYFERDGHECWPSNKGSVKFANEHNGKGEIYLTKNIPNLGEVGHPFFESANIILRYNGYWGCFHHKLNDPPPGPALHCEWTWPSNAKVNVQSGACRSCEF